MIFTELGDEFEVLLLLIDKEGDEIESLILRLGGVVFGNILGGFHEKFIWDITSPSIDTTNDG
jgi:hypothetical protein